jgi:hypothetical protein
MFVNFETHECIDRAALEALFSNVSFPPVIEAHHLSDKEPLFLVLEYDPEPVIRGLDTTAPGPIRFEDGRAIQGFIVVPATYEQWLEESTEILNALSRQAGAQLSAIGTRIEGLNFAIDGQDPEDPDYDPATPEEIAELPVRVAQRTKWNSYNRKLGQVKTQPGWPASVVWPAIPEPYTNEMSRGTSA